jgi:hypothetical protein
MGEGAKHWVGQFLPAFPASAPALFDTIVAGDMVLAGFLGASAVFTENTPKSPWI